MVEKTGSPRWSGAETAHRTRAMGLAGVVLGTLHVVLDEVLIEGTPDWRGLALGGLALAGTFGLLFLWVVPDIIRRASSSKSLMSWAFAMAGVALVTMVPKVLWLGVPYVVLAAAFSLGWAGLGRAPDSRARRQDLPMIILGVALAAGLVAASIMEWQD